MAALLRSPRMTQGQRNQLREVCQVKVLSYACVALVLAIAAGCEEDNRQYGKSDKGDLVRKEDLPEPPISQEGSSEDEERPVQRPR